MPLLITPLTGSHDRAGFDCGRAELNDWLRKVARQHRDKGLSRTFVAVRDEAPAIMCGYFALTLAEVINTSYSVGEFARESTSSYSVLRQAAALL